MSETIVPVAQAFGAVAVGGNAFEEILAVLLRGRDKEGPALTILEGRGGGDGHPGQADRVPVVRHFQPVFPRLAVKDHTREGLEDPPLQFAVQESPRFLRQLVPQPVIHRRQVGADGRGKQIDLEGGPVEHRQAAVMGGQDPTFLCQEGRAGSHRWPAGIGRGSPGIRPAPGSTAG